MKNKLKWIITQILCVITLLSVTSVNVSAKVAEEDPEYPTPEIISQTSIQAVEYDPQDVPSLGNCFGGSWVYPVNTSAMTIPMVRSNAYLYSGCWLEDIVKPYPYKYANGALSRYVIDADSSTYLEGALHFEVVKKIYTSSSQWYPDNQYKIYISLNKKEYYLCQDASSDKIFLICLSDPDNIYTEDDISIWKIDADNTDFTSGLCFLSCYTKSGKKNHYLDFDKESGVLKTQTEKTRFVSIVGEHGDTSEGGLMMVTGNTEPVIKYITTDKSGNEVTYYRIHNTTIGGVNDSRYDTGDNFFDAGAMSYTKGQEQLYEDYNGSKYEYNKTRAGYVGINKAASQFTFEEAVEDIEADDVATQASESIHTYYKSYGYKFNYYYDTDGYEDHQSQKLWVDKTEGKGLASYVLYIWRQYPLSYSFSGLESGDNMEVLTGSPLSEQVYEDCLSFNSGDYLIENNWIAFTVPYYLKCGSYYEIDLDTLHFYDEEGKEIDKSEFTYSLTSRYRTNDTILIENTPSYGFKVTCDVSEVYYGLGQLAQYENYFIYLSDMSSQVSPFSTDPVYSVSGSSDIDRDSVEVKLSMDPTLDSEVTNRTKLVDQYADYYDYTYTWYQEIWEKDATEAKEKSEIVYARNKTEFTYTFPEDVHDGTRIVFSCEINKKNRHIWNKFGATTAYVNITGENFDVEVTSLDESDRVLSDKIYLYIDNYDDDYYDYRTLFDGASSYGFYNGNDLLSLTAIDQESDSIRVSSEGNDLHQNKDSIQLNLSETISAPKAYSYTITKNGTYLFTFRYNTSYRNKTITVTNIAEDVTVNVEDVDNVESRESDVVFVNCEADIFKRITKAEVSKDGGAYTSVGFKEVNSTNDFLENNSFYSGSAYRYEITENGTYTFRLTDINGATITSEPITYSNLGVAHVHKLHKVDGTEFRCGVPGNVEYYYCEDCEKVFDAQGNELSYEGVFKNYKGHCEFEEVVIETHSSTCTEKGYTITEEVCKKCGYHKENSQTLHELELSEHTAGSKFYYDSLYHYHKCVDCNAKCEVSLHEYGDDDICDVCGYEKLSTPTISISPVLNETKYGTNETLSFDISIQGTDDGNVDYDVLWYEDETKTKPCAIPLNLNVEKEALKLKLIVSDNQFVDAGTYYFALSLKVGEETIISSVQHITINKRSVVLTSGSVDHQYDAKYFCCEEITVGGDGIAYGEGFTYSGFKTIYVGSTENTFDYAADDNTKLSNYDISTVYGTLKTVKKIRNNNNTIAIYALGASKVYDGTPLTPSSYSIMNFSGYTDQIVITGYTGSITNVGETSNIRVDTTNGYKVYHGDTDVTEYYSDLILSVIYPEYKLVVTKRPITVTSIGPNKARISKGTLADGESIEFINFREEDGKIKFDVNFTSGSADNYEITYAYCNATNFEGPLNDQDLYSVVYDYDGKAHSAGLKELYSSYLSDNNYEFRFFESSSSEYSVEEPTLTDVGVVNYTCKIYDLTNQTYLNDKEFSYTITINKRAVTLVYKASGDKVYDGTPYFEGNVSLKGTFAEGEGLATTTFTYPTIDVTTSGKTCSFSYTLKENTKASNYNISTDGSNNYVVKINKAPLTVASKTLSKIYDGEALTGGTMTVVDDSKLVSGHTINSKIESSITNVGTIKNSFASVAVMNGDTDVTSNYSITKLEGTLTIVPKEITITSGDATKTYDGTALSCEDIAVTSGSLAKDDKITCNNFASIIDAGSTKNTFDCVDNDNYRITKEYGDLIVEKAALTLVSDSGEKTYDGTALKVETVTITKGELFGDDSLTYTFYGHQLAAGSSANSFVVSGEDAKNYDISKTEGELTVKAIETPIIITTSSASKTYDGVNLSNGDYSYTPSVILSGDVLEASLSGSITNVGSCKNKLADYKVYHGIEDVTSSYTFAQANEGTLSILPKEVSVTADDICAVYGSKYKFTATVSGLLNNEKLNYDFEVLSEKIGKNAIKVSGEEYQGNYRLKFKNGTLTLSKSNTMSLSAEDCWQYYNGNAIGEAATCNIKDAEITYQIKTEENGAYGKVSKEVPQIINASKYYVLATATHPSYETVSVEYTLEISKSHISAPSVSACDETYHLKNDAYLLGISSEMEYKLGNEETYHEITQEDLSDEKFFVSPGIYHVRYKENQNHYASDVTALEVKEGRKINVYLNNSLIQTGDYGDKVNEPNHDEKEGYRFAGFYTDKAFTTKWNFEKDTLSKDLYLYPCYEEEPTVIIEDKKDETKEVTGEVNKEETKKKQNIESSKKETKTEEQKEDTDVSEKEESPKQEELQNNTIHMTLNVNEKNKLTSSIKVSEINLDEIKDEDNNPDNGYSGIVLSLDDSVLSYDKDYKISEDFEIVLSKKFLKKIETGEHVLKLSLTDGYDKTYEYEISLFAEEDANNHTGIVLALGAGTTVLAGTAFVLIRKRKNK